MLGCGSSSHGLRPRHKGSWTCLGQSEVEGAEREAPYALDSVVHGEHEAWSFELEDGFSLGRLAAVGRRKDHLEQPRAFAQQRLALVLVAIRVAPNNNWLSPSGHEPGHVADQNGSAENCAVQYVPAETHSACIDLPLSCCYLLALILNTELFCFLKAPTCAAVAFGRSHPVWLSDELAREWEILP